MVRIADDESAVPYQNRVMQAGMLCRTREFQYWLKENKLLERISEDEAINALYKLCVINSRTELNGNADAQKKFDEMVNDYDRWKKAEPF
jgi:hypothetical protein